MKRIKGEWNVSKLDSLKVSLLLLFSFSPFFSIFAQSPGAVSAGLTVWYKANDGISTPATWFDQSGGANNAAATGAPSLTGTINFNPAFYFNGASYFTAPTSANVSGNYSLFGVSQLQGTQNSRVFSNLLTNDLFGNYIGVQDVLYINGTPNLLTGVAVTLNLKIYDLSRNSTGTGPYIMRGNGLQLYSGATSSNSVWQLTMGGEWSGGANLSKVYIPEVITYNRELSPAEKLQVESYLALKYGTTLDIGVSNYVNSSSSPVYNNTIPGYWNNITGIGRDDNSALNQKQSQSANTAGNGNMITVGLGTIAATNIANPNTFGADKSFEVWGDNNATPAYSAYVSANGNPAINSKMARVWKVQETGTVGTVLVKTADVQATYLMVSADPSFATGVTEIAISSQQASIDFTGATGYYFTFASFKITANPGGVASPTLWLRGDDVPAGGLINTIGWQDFSQSANHLTIVNGVAPQGVDNTLNFDRGVVFAGNGYVSANGFTSAYTSGEFFSTAKTNVTGVNTGFMDLGAGGGLNWHYTWSDGGYYNPFGTTQRFGWNPSTGAVLSAKTGASAPAVTGINATDWHILNTYSAANNWGTSFDGRLVSSTATNTANFTAFGGYNAVGVAQNATYYQNGSMSEVILYNRVLTATERIQVNSYQAIKYGITLGNIAAPISYLASDGTTILWAGSTTYQNNVFGIGRDDVSALNQKQSQSVNTTNHGNLITIGLGSIAATNKANSNSFASTKSFLVIGDDGSTTNFVSAVTGTGLVNARMSRLWQVQNTNSVGAVQFSILAGGYSGTLYLVTSNDAIIDGTDTYTALSAITINGIACLATNVSFTNGSYFTIAQQLTFPGGVPGESLWLRADLGTSSIVNATAISAWNDQSGNGNHVSQATGVNQPLYDNNAIDNTNFNPVINFNGTTNNLIKPNGIMGSGITYTGAAVFAVTKTDVVSVSAIFREVLATGPIFNLHLPWSDGNLYWDGPSGAPRTTIAWGGTIGIPYLFSGLNDNSLGSNKEVVRHNGLQILTTNYAATFSGNNSNLYVGSVDVVDYYHGRMSEVIIYPAALTSTQHQQVESYLAIKHGVTLDQTIAQDYLASDGTTKSWDATLNAGNNNNIAGIGRDDITALNQKQSQSNNTANNGNLVTIGLGSIAATNSANANTFAADKSFDVWGDDGNSVTFSTVVSGTNMYRMMRLWRVKETGIVGSVSVSVPSTAFSPATTSITLIQSSDAILNSADNLVSLTLIGSNYVGSVDFANGDYFSFAQTAPAPGAVIAGLVTWYKANDGVSNSATWFDQSAGADNATATGAPSLTGTVNYNPAFYFNGVSNFKAPSSSNVSGNYSLFGVSQLQGTQNQRAFSNALTNDLFGYWSGKQDALYINNAPSLLTGVAATTNLKIYDLSRNSTGTGPYTMRGNGLQVYSGATSSNDVWQLTMGAWLSTEYSKVNIPEVITYNRELSPAEKLQVESYLAIKYGTTLDSTVSNYENSSGSSVYDNTITSYWHNIIGISRDDNSAQLQKQSHNFDDSVRIYKGTLAATNAANTAVFAADQSYVVTGANTGLLQSTAASSLEVPPAAGLYSRLEREWKVVQNNFSETFNMDITLAPGANPSSVNIADLRLLVDDDGNFTNATVYAAGGGLSFSYSNPVITITGISNTQIPNNSTKFITIASASGSTPLPIELLDFSGLCGNNDILIKWTTAIETNNEYFTLERSTDLNHFTAITQIKGHGNSSVVINYNYTDNNIEEGIFYYYRLKQTDFDGISTYSKIVYIDQNCSNESANFSIYPNPTNGNLLKLVYNSAKDQNAVIKFTGVLGQICLSKTVQLHKGINNEVVSLDNLNPGVYFIQIESEKFKSPTLEFIRN
ncbi:MAG TPA: T9SS type A sorting domain-containing protein [Puia sp.]|nr:T9SS type A sorting domain-containing protein [Puia sp.]